jgi:hypothetical protein
MPRKNASRIIGSENTASRYFVATNVYKHRITHTQVAAPPVKAVTDLSTIPIRHEDSEDSNMFEADSSLADAPLECHVGVKIQQNPKKRYLNSVSISRLPPICTRGLGFNYRQDAPLLTWRDNFREEYLEQSLALEGRGRLWGLCGVCGAQPASFRCQDCTGLMPMCRVCAIDSHRLNPLHILEVRHELSLAGSP